MHFRDYQNNQKYFSEEKRNHGKYSLNNFFHADIGTDDKGDDFIAFY